jgi:hypothetical protein
MSFRALLFWSLLAIASASCQKTMNSPTAGMNPTTYELTSIVWSGVQSNGQSFHFQYDSAHLLTAYTWIEWGAGGYNITDSGNIPIPGWTDTVSFRLEYSNGRVRRLYTSDPNGPANGFTDYSYDTKGRLVGTSYYAPDGTPAQGRENYSYDANGRVSDKWLYDGTGKNAYHYCFSFDSLGNLAKEVDSTLFENPILVYIFTYPKYDTHVNWLRTINGYPITFSSDNNFGEGSSLSPNNYQTVLYDANPQGGVPAYLMGLSTITYDYQYNDAGLPVQMQLGPWTTTFTYKKY